MYVFLQAYIYVYIFSNELSLYYSSYIFMFPFIYYYILPLEPTKSTLHYRRNEETSVTENKAQGIRIRQQSYPVSCRSFRIFSSSFNYSIASEKIPHIDAV